MSEQDPQDVRVGAAPPSPPPPRRRLVRRTDDQMIAGVASGLAAYFDVDPALVRIAFVVLGLVGPGVPLYIAAWLIMPVADDADHAGAPIIHHRGTRFWVGIGLLVIVALALSHEFGFFGRGILWPLVLIGIGVALWRNADARGAPAPHVAPPASSPPPPQTHAPTTEAGMGSQPPVHPSAADTWTVPVTTTWRPPPPPPRSVLARVTLGTTLLALGVAAFLDRAGTIDLTLHYALALALAVIGAGLVVGTWFGRARWLIVVGLVLLPFVAASGLLSALDIPSNAGLGDRRIRVDEVGELEPSYALTAGELTLDLRDLDLSGRTVDLDVAVGAGQLEVWLPQEATVEIAAEATVGQIEIRTGEVHSLSGTRLEREVLIRGPEEAGRLRLDLRVAAGQVMVRSERLSTPLEGSR